MSDGEPIPEGSGVVAGQVIELRPDKPRTLTAGATGRADTDRMVAASGSARRTGGGNGVLAGAPPVGTPINYVSFSRRELGQVLNLYGRMVAMGEWRDYAIDTLRDSAVFSVFRRSSEMPIYRIVKDPKLARRQGAYSVISATGVILKRGHDLERVLAVLDRNRVRLIEG